MKRCIKCMLLLCLMFLCALIPFGSGAAAPKNRYIVQAQVILYKNESRQIWSYHQPKKINSILNYLRTTDPRGRVYTAQPVADSHNYRIILYYSDGSQNAYHLQDYRYFCKGTGLWQRVSPSHAQLLYPLLQLLPPDR